jgi:hypothetical protein
MWAMTKSDHDELTAYRRLGLSPDEIAAKLVYLNDPAPLPFEAEDGITYDERGFPIAVNMDDLARAMDKEQWEK